MTFDKQYFNTPNRWFGIRPWTRHSLVLLVAGLCYAGVGVSYMLSTPASTAKKTLIIAEAWMSLHHWGLVFVVVGLLTIISSRWPPTADKWGYMVMTGLSAGWAAFYAMGVIVGGTPVSSLSGTWVWSLLAFMWWGISGLVNPVKVVIIDGSGGVREHSG